MTNYLEQRLIDFVFNSNAEFSFSSPANVYVALFTSATADDGTGTEVTGTNYARVDTGSFTAMTNITDGQTENTNDIVFPTAGSGGWGTVTHIALFDALTGGNMLFHGALSQSKEILDGNTFSINAGGLVLTLS